ncbi:hypothetical protein ANN_26534 [Periplaneta americana]|uniref:Uncharacterized protein n=1 Tax=Periplaneta americana TaxID=6978 RepID=A0ABQ8RYU9_PERAM|nr:hypothetical protein ANN_26534 [Periplaneta americana]
MTVQYRVFDKQLTMSFTVQECHMLLIYGESRRNSSKNRGRVCSTELVSILRSRKMFAFSSDESSFYIESYFRTEPVSTNARYHNIMELYSEDVQNIQLLLEHRPHIDVSLTCEHDPKLQEYCVCPQNMPQFDSEGIPNQAPETNKPMILNGPTIRNREGSDQVSVEAKQLGHLYLSIDQETFDPSTGEPYD